MEKIRVMRVYNKWVMEKSFQVAQLVWKTILPIGSRSGRFGKWSPSWDEPYVVSKIVPGNAYFVEMLEGHKLSKALNGKYEKKYYHSTWHEA
jgi:hypothetical protein